MLLTKQLLQKNYKSAVNSAYPSVQWGWFSKVIAFMITLISLAEVTIADVKQYVWLSYDVILHNSITTEKDYQNNSRGIGVSILLCTGSWRSMSKLPIIFSINSLRTVAGIGKRSNERQHSPDGRRSSTALRIMLSSLTSLQVR